jgi:hypothetical protein
MRAKMIAENVISALPVNRPKSTPRAAGVHGPNMASKKRDLQPENDLKPGVPIY